MRPRGTSNRSRQRRAAQERLKFGDGIPSHRAPGPCGVFVEDALHGETPRQWQFEGWPANSNLPRPLPSWDSTGGMDPDYYYALSAQGKRP